MSSQMKDKENAAFIEPSIIEPEKHQCYLLYLVGFGPGEIETKTGVPSNRIRGWMFKEKWAKQREQYEEMLQEKHPTMAQPIVQSVIRSRKGERRKDFLEHTGEMAVADAQHWSSMDPQERIIVAPAIGTLNAVHRKNLGLEDEADGGEKSHISLTFLTKADDPGMVRVIDSSAVRMIEAPPKVSTNIDDY